MSRSVDLWKVGPYGLLDDERERYLVAMRELTHARRVATTDDRVVLDYQIFHIEADLRWIEHTAARLRRGEHP